ncbi:hypothetical protein AZF37_07610 [endosymbiont 'TC1' of Trimyema compressum]|uniref:hypothetical protein n=1 Tax=endosymbiont 'TC1' of Trimyema compressum TaxID=243899 RepID=UPI0007F0957F|nr:hypothetical protein [endosymbiont 'TC1' of Trimyema compressum]AMP21046.1 hypothetical protein AZF37_07610 [endosymbiont 'TC1' of Trimyema compressum]
MNKYEGGLFADIKLEEQIPKRTAYIKTITTMKALPKLLDKTFIEISNYLQEQDIKPIGGPFAAYFGFDKNALNVHLGWLISYDIVEDKLIKMGE